MTKETTRRTRKPRKTLAKYLGVTGSRSAYILFVNAKRGEKKDANGTASNTELVSLLAKDWGKLSDSQKRTYERQAQKDRKRYKKELAKAVKENPEKVEEFKKIKHKKQKREQYGVTGYRSAYILFSSEVRPQLVTEFPDEKMVEITKRIGARWRELDDAAKRPYEERAAEDRERYTREYEAAKTAHLAQQENESINTEEAAAAATAEATPTRTARRTTKKTSKSSKTKATRKSRK